MTLPSRFSKVMYSFYPVPMYDLQQISGELEKAVTQILIFKLVAIDCSKVTFIIMRFILGIP